MIAKKLRGRLSWPPSFDLPLFRGRAEPVIGAQVAHERRGAADRGEYREAAGAIATLDAPVAYRQVVFSHCR